VFLQPANDEEQKGTREQDLSVPSSICVYV
jgi:hypothetical protein